MKPWERDYGQARLGLLRERGLAVDAALELGLLSARSRNCLWNDGIETLAELVVVGRTPADLRRTPNFGDISMLELGLLLTALQLVVPSFDYRNDELLACCTRAEVRLHWPRRFEITGTERPAPGAAAEPDLEQTGLALMARDLRRLTNQVGRLEGLLDSRLDHATRRTPAEAVDAVEAAGDISDILAGLATADAFSVLAATVVDTVRDRIDTGQVTPHELEVFHGVMVKALVGLAAGDARTSVTAEHVEKTGADLGLKRPSPLASLPRVHRPKPEVRAAATGSGPVAEKVPEDLVIALMSWRELEAFFEETPELLKQQQVDDRLAALRRAADIHFPRLRAAYRLREGAFVGADLQRRAERLEKDWNADGERRGGWLRRLLPGATGG